MTGMAVRAGSPVVATVCVCLAMLGGCATGSAASPQPIVTSAPATVTTTPASSATTLRPTGSETSTVKPVAKPPFISRVQWVRGSGGRSLQVFPTSSGRTAKGTTDDDEAWSEVLRLAPDADQPGLRAQFDCHWTFARVVEPDKPSWNLEPWRPVVTEKQMVDARCNPGAPESAES
jgi:hypothetical protein